MGPISDSNPFIINATLFGVKGPYTLQLTNVLFGDVWVCAGHNKMQFPVDKVQFSRRFVYYLLLKLELK